MARSDFGHKFSPIAPGATCSLCGHTGTPADLVERVTEYETTEDHGRLRRQYSGTTLRCMDAFACQDRRAKSGIR